MAVSDDLFQLVKSLTKSEKGYFKKYAYKNISGEKSSASGNDYLKLFDLLDRQTDYNEDKVLKKLSKTGLVGNFSGSKNYLFKLLMNCLADYHAAKMPTAQIASQLVKAKLLSKKGLRSQANIFLKKASKLAQQEDFTAIKPLVHFTALTCGSAHSVIAKDQPVYEDAISAYIESGERIAMDGRYHKLSIRVLDILKQDESLRSQEMHEALDQQLADPLLQESDFPATFYSRHIFLSHKQMLLNASGYKKQTIEINERIIDFWKDETSQQTANPGMFIGALANVFASDIECNEGKLFNKYKYLLENFEPELTTTMVSKRNAIIYLEQRDLTSRKKFTELNEFGKTEIFPFVQQYGELLPPDRIAFIFYQLCFTAMQCEKWEEAIEWLNHIAQSNQNRLSRSDKMQWRVLLLINHYELENWDLLPSLIVAAYRHLLKQDAPLRTEKALVQCIRNLPARFEKRALKEAFAELRNQVTEFKDDPLEKGFEGYFNLVEWLDEKIGHLGA